MPDVSEGKDGAALHGAAKTKHSDEGAHKQSHDTGTVSKLGGLADFFTDFFGSMCSLGTKKDHHEGEHEEDEDHSDDEEEKAPGGMEATMIAAAEEQLYGLTATDGGQAAPTSTCYRHPRWQTALRKWVVATVV